MSKYISRISGLSRGIFRNHNDISQLDHKAIPDDKYGKEFKRIFLKFLNQSNHPVSTVFSNNVSIDERMTFHDYALNNVIPKLHLPQEDIDRFNNKEYLKDDKLFVSLLYNRLFGDRPMKGGKRKTKRMNRKSRRNSIVNKRKSRRNL